MHYEETMASLTELIRRNRRAFYIYVKLMKVFVAVDLRFVVNFHCVALNTTIESHYDQLQ